MVNFTFTLLKRVITLKALPLLGVGAISRQIHLHLFWCSIGKNGIGL